MIDIDRLDAIYGRVRAAIERNMAASSETPAGQVSEFWAEIFADRKNFPDLNDIMTFRRDGFAYGIGDDRQQGYEQEKQYSERTYHIFRRMVSEKFVGSLPETSFGAPLVFRHGEIARSASFWINAATTARVKQFVERFGKQGPLRILEIGSGWGACAFQLHHALDVESYTLVDLPHNLQISAIHLATVLPDRVLEFVDVDGPAVEGIPPQSIAACLPGTMGRLQAKYDVILNSFSLQEMTIETVNAYLKWIASALSDDGLFVSFNSHAKAGVAQTSDYHYEKFYIHHWDVFRSSPSGYHNTIPYEVVLGRPRPGSPQISSAAQNGLGWLMQLGLDRDLRPCADALLAGDEPGLLLDFARFFSASDDAERQAILDDLAIRDATAITPFVAAHLSLVRGERDRSRALLDQALQRGLAGFARVRAHVLLACYSASSGKAAELQPVDGLDAAFAYPEVAAMIASGDAAPLVAQTNRIFRRTPSRAAPAS